VGLALSIAALAYRFYEEAMQRHVIAEPPVMIEHAYHPERRASQAHAEQIFKYYQLRWKRYERLSTSALTRSLPPEFSATLGRSLPVSQVFPFLDKSIDEWESKARKGNTALAVLLLHLYAKLNWWAEYDSLALQYEKFTGDRSLTMLYQLGHPVTAFWRPSVELSPNQY
tara:strand:+ start:163 stop:672 length:510 start_codon:yes stop_codon:yes gene_type:complete